MYILYQGLTEYNINKMQGNLNHLEMKFLSEQQHTIKIMLSLDI